MKAKLLLDQERGPTTPAEFAEWTKAMKSGQPNPLGIIKAGTVIDHKHAHYLVKNGQAVPEDDECREACNLTNEEIADRLANYKLLEAGKLTGDSQIDAPDDEDDDE